MFYCGECQKKKEWPESLFMSRGKCEICGKQAVCFDVPSSQLPMPDRIIARRLGPVTKQDPAELLFEVEEKHKVLDVEVRGTVVYTSGEVAGIDAVLDGTVIGRAILNHPEILDADDKPQDIDNYSQSTFRIEAPSELGLHKLEVKLVNCKWSGPAALKVKDVS